MIASPQVDEAGCAIDGTAVSAGHADVVHGTTAQVAGGEQLGAVLAEKMSSQSHQHSHQHSKRGAHVDRGMEMMVEAVTHMSQDPLDRVDEEGCGRSWAEAGFERGVTDTRRSNGTSIGASTLSSTTGEPPSSPPGSGLPTLDDDHGTPRKARIGHEPEMLDGRLSKT